MTVVGGVLVIVDLTIARSAVADPYSWSELQNQMYYCFTRWTYVIGAMLIAFSILFSPNPLIKEFLRRPFFRGAGSLCLLNALLTPLVIQLNYNSLPDGLFITFYVVIALGLANAALITSFSLVLYLLLQYPLQVATSRWTDKYLSQRKTVEKHLAHADNLILSSLASEEELKHPTTQQ